VREERARANARKPKRALKPKRSPAPARSRAKRPADSSELERQIEAAEATLRAVEEELADPAAWSDPARSAESSARHEAAKREVEDLYARWEQVAG
jgi:ATP-binding cassette subfamily F protein 3